MIRKYLLGIIFIGIFIIGLLLRAPEVIARNYLFGFDQGRDYLAAYSIAEDHKLTLIGAEVGAGSAGLTGLFHGPGYFYLLAIMEKLFHGDPYGGVVLMFIFGVAAMILTFLVAKKLFGTLGGLVCFYLVSTAPLIAPQSRFIWNHHLTSPIIVVYLLLLYLLVSKKQLLAKAYVLPFLVTFVAGMLYHFELAISVPLVVSTFVILLISKERRGSVYLAAIAGAVLAYAPMLFFESRHGFMAFRGILTYVLGTGSHKSSLTWLTFNRHLGSFIANARDTFVFEYGFIRPSDYITAIKLFFGIVLLSYLLSSHTVLKRFIRALVCIIITSFVVFMFLNNDVWNYYLIHLHFVYIFFFGFSLVTMIEVFSHRRALGARITSGLSLVFLLYFLLSIGQGVQQRIYMNVTVDYPDFGGKEKIAGKRYIIDYIYADAKGQPFNVLVFTPPVYTYPYDYLFKTYAKQKYGYSPGNEKKGLTYLIMEIDGTKPWSWQGWLETVIKGGTVLSHEYVKKPDLILEKRMF